jgi:DNA-binding GntR family transcriptional regulator
LKQSERYTNLVDSVYAQLFDLVNSRGLASTEVLNASSLAQELGVSRTPVTMALMRLESLGLIRRHSAKGWITVPLSLEDIGGIFDLKRVLEPLEARRAAENITPEAARALVDIVEEMEQASQVRDVKGWLAADRLYHGLLHEIAGNRRLKQFQEQLNSQLYRLDAGYVGMKGRMAAACSEHRSVAEAVSAGDPDLAAERAQQHIVSLRESLTSVVRDLLMPFLGREL